MTAAGVAVAVVALSVRVAGGTASLDGVGTLTASLRSGSAWISGATSADFEFLGARYCVPAGGGGEICTGTRLRVALRRRGTYDLLLQGTGIEATLAGSGTALVDATRGSFRLHGGPRRPLRRGAQALRY